MFPTNSASFIITNSTQLLQERKLANQPHFDASKNYESLRSFGLFAVSIALSTVSCIVLSLFSAPMSSISANVTIPDSQDALPSPSPVVHCRIFAYISLSLILQQLLPESFIPSNKTKREASDSEHSEVSSQV